MKFSEVEREPLEFTLSCLLQEGHFNELDDISSVDEFIHRINPEDAITILHESLVYIKLARSLLRVCDEVYVQHETPAEEALGEMIQMTKDNQYMKQEKKDVAVFDEEINSTTLPARESTGVVSIPPQSLSLSWFTWLQDTRQKIQNTILQSTFGQESIPEESDDFMNTTSDIDASDTMDIPQEHHETSPMHSHPLHVENAVHSMGLFPDDAKVQFNGLRVLAEHAAKSKVGAFIELERTGGFDVIIRSLSFLKKSKKAQIIGLSLFGCPDWPPFIPKNHLSACQRVTEDGMKTFQSCARIQGLGCLALANLSTANEPVDFTASSIECIVTAMERFDTDTTIQAAACLALRTICALNDDMAFAALDAGGLASVEKCKLRFPEDQRIQQEAMMALECLLNKRNTSSERCSLM